MKLSPTLDNEAREKELRNKIDNLMKEMAPLQLELADVARKNAEEYGQRFEDLINKLEVIEKEINELSSKSSYKVKFRFGQVDFEVVPYTGISEDMGRWESSSC